MCVEEIGENILYICIYYRRRRRKFICLNRRMSKEIIFKGEDEMFIRLFYIFEDKMMFFLKLMFRIDIDIGFL